MQVKIGVIGGSGLYQIAGMEDVEEISVKTPFGDPSDKIIVGKLKSNLIAFLPRHGREHRISPSEIPGRANIYALKSLGVERIIAVNSSGSYKEEIRPGDIVIPDQIIDKTKKRSDTFFEGGIVAHVGFAEPFCPDLSEILYQAAKETGARVHKGGTYVAMEGPAFSSKAESLLHKSWGASVIGMTMFPEARLAREAEICYASLTFVTDYDCWHERHEVVTIEMILNVMRKNVDLAKNIVKMSAGRVQGDKRCFCSQALKNTIVTASEHISPEVKERLSFIIGKYIN
ncbi:MAG: S-methyl-5'-thioadenosine phosphorylase [Chloroflexi bacterium]|nr:S-methyl-5'-thioadenosine phosphorylase [Chloroflexota bacterium]